MPGFFWSTREELARTKCGKQKWKWTAVSKNSLLAPCAFLNGWSPPTSALRRKVLAGSEKSWPLAILNRIHNHFLPYINGDDRVCLLSLFQESENRWTTKQTRAGDKTDSTSLNTLQFRLVEGGCREEETASEPEFEKSIFQKALRMTLNIHG